MKKLFRPASLLFYFLVFLCFFVFGTTFAVLIDAAKGQGLAGSAIVLGYGVMFGFFAILASFFLVYYLPVKSIIRLNKIFSALLLLLILIITIRYFTRKQPKTVEFQQKHISESVHYVNHSTLSINHSPQASDDLGLGFYKPNFLASAVIYFYGNPNIYKTEQSPTPSDSIVFGKTDYGSFEIVYAPPWLLPEILKMDYEMLLFRVISAGNKYAEVIVNKRTQQTAYVRRTQGDILFWPEFLLRVNSVKMLPQMAQQVRIKALSHASEVNVNYEFMKPLMVRNEWLFVELRNSEMQPAGNGWIRWNSEGKLLISYSLLS